MSDFQTAITKLFSPGGRIARRGFWTGMIAVTLFVALAEPPLALRGGPPATIILFLPCCWAWFCLMSRRCHDTGRSAGWLLLLLIPILGFLWLIAVLFFRRGDHGANQYGPDPHPPAPDYLTVKPVS